MKAMTASPEISQLQTSRLLNGGLCVFTRELPAPSNLADMDDYEPTEQFDLEGDLPTSSLDPAAPLDAEAPQAQEVGLQSPFIKSQTAARSHKIATRREIGPGSVLRGRYLIDRAIGVGGTSTVYSARDRHRTADIAGESDLIAVKVLRSDKGRDDARVFRLEREFRQMQRLTHAGIVRVFDLDAEDDLWFITMELLSGLPLHRYLRGELKTTEAISILSQCTEALIYAHSQGVVHGDLKPGNVFVAAEGHVRLFDFGSAPDLKDAAANPDGAHRFAATPPYASPETLEGKGVEARDDLFSIGCLAYELLSGGLHPFDRMSSLDARQQGLRPPYVNTIRPRHFAIIAKALSWSREDRPRSAREFLHAFLASEFSCNSAAAYRTKSIESDSAFRVQLHENGNAVSDTHDTQAFTGTPSEESKSSIDIHAKTSSDDAASTGNALPDTGAEQQTRRFTGFVPQESVAGPERVRATRWEYPELQAAGLSEKRRWLRPVLATAVLLAVLASIYFLGKHLQASTALPPTTLVSTLTESKIAAVVPANAETISLVSEVVPEVPLPATLSFPKAAGEVSFQNATVNVGAGQSMAVLNITRSKSTYGMAPVAWSTVGESARPGVHYESFDDEISRFNDGQDIRSLFIPLKFDPTEAHSRPERSFVVKLERTAGSPLLGTITQARVVIEGSSGVSQKHN